LRVDELSK
jgi:chromosome segregation ATPase